MKSIGINFPFTETYDGGVIGVTQTDVQKIKSNLTAYLTLKKGHRVMNNSLYSPLYDYVMEVWDEISQTSLNDDLTQKIAYFFPEIQVKKINYDFDENNNLLHIKIIYAILDLGVQDSVEISLALES